MATASARSPWRFFLDHNIPASVATMLRIEGYHCWTASDAGLAGEGQDDNLTIYADEHNAVLVTLDREFSRRRLKNSIGRHIWLRCPEPEVADLLRSNLDQVLPLLERDNVIVTVSKFGIQSQSTWE